jgi:hypothetical protein
MWCRCYRYGYLSVIRRLERSAFPEVQTNKVSFKAANENYSSVCFRDGLHQRSSRMIQVVKVLIVA